MDKIVNWFSAGRNRRYVYRVTNTALGVFVLYGVLNGDEAAAFLLVANAALGLADANVTDE